MVRINWCDVSMCTNVFSYKAENNHAMTSSKQARQIREDKYRTKLDKRADNNVCNHNRWTNAVDPTAEQIVGIPNWMKWNPIPMTDWRAFSVHTIKTMHLWPFTASPFGSLNINAFYTNHSVLGNTRSQGMNGNASTENNCINLQMLAKCSII